MEAKKIEQKKNMLMARNAQLVFIRKLKERGAQGTEESYQFLDEGAAKNLVDSAIENDRKHRDLEKRVASIEEAKIKAKNWILTHQGSLLCFVRDVGVVLGISSQYLADLEQFQYLVGDFLRFETPDHKAAFSMLQNEDGCFVLEWDTQ